MKEGWEVKKLDEFCDIEYGTRVVRKRDGGTIYPVYGGGGATFFMDVFNRKDCLVVARFAMSEKCTRFVRGEFFLNDSGLTIKPKDSEQILQEFLNLQFFYLNDYIYSLARGTAQKNLNVPKFRKIELVIPPLPEQTQIVKTLDLVFAKLDRAKANLEQNLHNAQELFESKLNEVFSQRGEGWVEHTWDDVLTIRSGRNQKEVENPNGKYPIIGSAGKIMGYADKYICEENTTIVGRKGTINNPILMKTKFWNVDTAFGLHASEILDKRYLFYFCRNFDFTQLDKGSGRPSLVKSDLLKIKILIPPLDKQKEMVKKLAIPEKEILNLQTHYKQKLNKLEELKKSILEKAFRGELG